MPLIYDKQVQIYIIFRITPGPIATVSNSGSSNNQMGNIKLNQKLCVLYLTEKKKYFYHELLLSATGKVLF